MISEFLEAELGKQELQSKVIEKLQREICDRIPQREYAICENIVKSYVPILITQMVLKLQHNELCYVSWGWGLTDD